MTTKAKGHHIDVQGTLVEVVRKDIKNLHVGVYPPSGRVRVAAPLRLDDTAVRLAVITRLGWIRPKNAARCPTRPRAVRMDRNWRTA